MSEIAPLIFIVRDEQRYQTFAWLCQQANIPCVRADGGLHALTQLERTPASAIVCEDHLTDMRGLELWNIVRSDPTTAQLHFFLLDAAPPDKFGTVVDHTLGREVCTLLALRSILQVIAPGQALPPVLSPDATPELQCASQTFSLPELITWLNENRKTGHWLIRLGIASGYLIMRKGEIIYGEFADERGQGSLLAIMLENADGRQEEVSYYAVESLTEGVPRNIQMATKQLLVAATVSLDHLNAKIIG